MSADALVHLLTAGRQPSEDDTVVDEGRIRLDAIQYVRTLRDRWVAVPAAELRNFVTDGRHVHLKGQQGIFKPAEMSDPLSITSTIDSSYADETSVQGSRVLYDFAPRSREHENDGLKRCAEAELPLIYFLQTKRKPNPEYIVFAPVFVVGWDDGTRRFLVELAEQSVIAAEKPTAREMELPALESLRRPEALFDAKPLTKSYVPTTVQRRLHQARFRNDVLAVYSERCAVCVLRVRPLLDAAHVVADREPTPQIVINEGLALCATHHRAFDANIIRYDSTYMIRVELPERAPVGDGERSMLLAFDGKLMSLPSDSRWWPVPLDR
jgi:putative restriction endonuclease